MATSPHPDNLLDELNRLEHLRDPSKSALAQRQFERFVIRGDAELHPMDRSKLDATPVEIKLRDIGRAGIGFISPRRLDVGSSWRVSFMDRGYVIGQQPIIVRHCRVVGPQLFLIGGQFVIENGLMVLLGVEPAKLSSREGIQQMDPASAAEFLPPAEVA